MHNWGHIALHRPTGQHPVLYGTPHRLKDAEFCINTPGHCSIGSNRNWDPQQEIKPPLPMDCDLTSHILIFYALYGTEHYVIRPTIRMPFSVSELTNKGNGLPG
jgi:hypothetical protein